MNYLLNPITEQNIYVRENKAFKCIVSEVQGWKKFLEDYHTVNLELENNISIFGIFDGHCGNDISNYCKIYFSNFLTSSLEFKEKKYRKALYKSTIKFDNFWLEKNISKKLNFKNLNSGSTFLILLVVNNICYISNLGDSKLFLYNNIKGVVSLTRDHRPELPKERIRIENAGGYVKSNRVNEVLSVSRSIGDFEFKNNIKLKYKDQIISCVPDINKYKLTIHDKFLILGSDGLFEKFNKKEICKFIKTQMKNKIDEKKIIYNLIENSISSSIYGNGCDNITIIFIRIK